MEKTIVGASKPYTDADILTIYTGRGGQWECSPCFQGRKLIAAANITLTGSRSNDYLAAEANTQRHIPQVTVWHHVHNFDKGTGKCTLQLVNWNDHESSKPHAGGCKQYEEFHGCSYLKTPPHEKTLPPVFEIPAYSAKELDDFSKRTGLSLTPELRRFYSGDVPLSRDALAYAARQDFLLDTVLPLWDQDKASIEGIHRFLQDLPCSEQLKDMRVIGMSACGDYFCADKRGELWFHDHEADQCYKTDLDLNQLRR